MKKYDLVSLGHISLDLFFRGKNLTSTKDRFQLAIGGKYVADEFRFNLGGGGFNVAVGVHKHRFRTAICASIGNNPFRPYIFEKFRQLNLPKTFLLHEPNYINISTILIHESGERSIINYETKHEKLFATSRAYKRLLHAHAIYLGNLPEISFKEREHVLRYAKAHNIVSFVNLGVSDCRRPIPSLKKFFEDATVVIANAHEIADMAKLRYEMIDFEQDILGIIPFLRDRLVVVTDSKKGSYGYLGGRVFHQRALEPPKIVDTTGAGDAYSAGFISEYVRTENIGRAMRNGAVYARKILGKIGAN